jgi:formylglycine-generating enzyme required for sulfatase activity/serine/threonine protein kinase
MPNEISGNASASSTAGFDPEYLRAGQRISETFTLRNVIPSSLGEFPVWIAEDEVAGRQVCLHFVPSEVAVDPALRAALKEEVRKTRKLHHDHILRVHEFIEGPDWAAVVTNFYEGQSLARHLQESPVGAFECADVKPWLDTLLQTMSDVHSVPVLHRNLSPADLILGPDGSLTVANFGTRRVIVDALRRAGLKEGKYLAYTSPQLLEGAAPSVSDDIYAIGATLFQLLTGKRPFEGVDVESRIVSEKPPGVLELRHKLNRDGQELFKNWERTIAQCLSKEPMERPINIGDLAKRLSGEPEAAPKEAPKAAPKAAPAAVETPKPKEPEPQHMGMAADEHDEEPEAPPVRERTSTAPRPLLTSYSPEPRGNRSKFALVALLLLAGGVGAWFGASFFMHKVDDVEEDEPALTSTPSPKETEPESDIKFVAPNAPDSAPALTALRPGQLPKTKPGLPNGMDPALEGTPVPVSPEPPARTASSPSAETKGVGPLASSASAPAAPALPAVDETDATVKRAQDAARAKVDPAKQDAIAKREQELARKAQEIEMKEREVARKEQEAMARKEQDELEKIKAQKPPVAVAPPVPEAKSAKPAAPVAATVPPAKPEKVADKAPEKPAEKTADKAPVKPAAMDAAKDLAKEDAPKAPEAAALENSLGMKFVKVGDVLFSTNKTRVKDYAQFVKETGYPKTHWKNPGFEQTENHPVVMVSWTDALSFCKWLTDKETAAGLLAPGESYRLPTDLEWSKGVGLPLEKGQTPEMRDMGIQDQYPWGKAWPPPKGAGNYTGKETGAEVFIAGYDDGFPFTAPVGSFPANAQGLYDMGGNAWEWCMDPWNPKARSRVLRGASWQQGALQLSLLSSCRIHSMPDRESDNYSFRVVRASSGKSR